MRNSLENEEGTRRPMGAALAVGAGLGTALSVGIARYTGDWATGYAIGMPVGVGLSLFITMLFSRRGDNA